MNKIQAKKVKDKFKLFCCLFIYFFAISIFHFCFFLFSYEIFLSFKKYKLTDSIALIASWVDYQTIYLYWENL